MRFNLPVFSASLLFLSSLAVALPGPSPHNGLSMRSALAEIDVPLIARHVERDGILTGTVSVLLNTLSSLADTLLDLAKSGATISQDMFKALDGTLTTLVNLGVDIPADLLEKIQEIRDYLESQ